MIRRDLWLILSAVPAALLLSWEAGAQQPVAVPPPRNLQVLPADTSQSDLLEIMQSIAAALGVTCEHCHVPSAPPATGRRGGGPGQGGPAAVAFDFASDEKPQKQIARTMMVMLRETNARVAEAVGRRAESADPVSCVTCHRGVAVPQQLSDILDRTTREQGTPAAIARFRDLRRRHFGGQAYDFTEGSLLAYAQQTLQANRPDDAIAWLGVTLEYFPLSSRAYVALAQAYQQKNDRDASVRNLEKAIELDPQNAQIRRQLEQLAGR
jgi:hypothetical protein